MIADTTVRYLGVATYTLLACYVAYWLFVSCCWCGLSHPKNIVRMFLGGFWCVFVWFWYVMLPMTAVIILDLQRRLRGRRQRAPNQASHATSEPAPGAASSVRECGVARPGDLTFCPVNPVLHTDCQGKKSVNSALG